MFNSFWECSALLWVVNQAFRTGFFTKGTAEIASKVLQAWVLGAGGEEIPWALQVLLV